MELELIRIAIALIGCLLATYYDLFNQRNIPNNLTYPLVALGILVNLYPFSLASLAELLPVFAVSLVVFCIGYLFYLRGSIGGADILVFTALSLLLPSAPNALRILPQRALLLSLPSFPFILSLFILSGFLFALYMVAKYVLPAVRDMQRGRVKTKKSNLLVGIFLVLLAFAFSVLYTNAAVPLSPVYLVLFTFLLLSTGFFTLLKDHIAENYFIESVPVEKLEEEDVIMVEKLDVKLVSKFNIKPLLTRDNIERIKQSGLKLIPVYTKLPAFMPYILLALILSLVFGDPLEHLLNISFN
ncbi:MAG: prepilin peptidase [Candidatus Micrarchaeota archaeon]